MVLFVAMIFNYCIVFSYQLRQWCNGLKLRFKIMNTLLETGKVLGGGIVELHTVEGFFFVKASVDGVETFSNAVSEKEAKRLKFHAIYNGLVNF